MKENRVNKKLLRKFGYKSDQQGIINRYLREMGQWDTHLWKCRKYILDTVKLYEPETVTFLGSGWLLDIPAEEVAGTCKKVNLADLVHPPQVKHKIEKFSNVEAIEQDLTGGMIEEIWKAYKNKTDIGEIEAPVYEPDFDAGMVFSVNLLTQLDSLPADFLAERTVFDRFKIRKVRAAMQKAHIRYLRKNNSVLISDYIEYIKKEDQVVEKNDLVFTSMPNGKRKEEWTWEFDMSGNYYSGKRVIFGVQAVDLVKQKNGKD